MRRCLKSQGSTQCRGYKVLSLINLVRLGREMDVAYCLHFILHFISYNLRSKSHLNIAFILDQFVMAINNYALKKNQFLYLT